MANLEDKETPNIITPKKNKKFSKRVVITIAAVGTLVLLVIGIAGITPPRERATRTAGEETLKMASAEQALDIDKKVYEASLPSMSDIVNKYKSDVQEADTPSPQKNEQAPLMQPVFDGAKQETAESSLSDADRDRLNYERAARRQWLELQREAFLSSPAASQGGNWSGHERQRESETQDTQTSRRGIYDDNPYLEIYNKYLEHESNKAAGEASQSQSDKEKFFNQRNSGKGILTSSAQAPISPYLIPSGSMIPCNLITGVNSDLLGYVVAQVAENVCDWKNPDVILIPQGTRVFGIYDSKIAFAQRRVQISWSRLIYPDGTTLDLQGMPGADKRGYSGLSDKYYPRYGRLLTAAIMTAAFSSVGLLFDDDNDTVVSTGGSTVVIPDNGNNARNEFAREIADSIGNAGEQLFNKYLNSQPTVLIRPAKRFNIVVNADVPFFSSYGRTR